MDPQIFNYPVINPIEYLNKILSILERAERKAVDRVILSFEIDKKDPRNNGVSPSIYLTITSITIEHTTSVLTWKAKLAVIYHTLFINLMDQNPEHKLDCYKNKIIILKQNRQWYFD